MTESNSVSKAAKMPVRHLLLINLGILAIVSGLWFHDAPLLIRAVGYPLVLLAGTAAMFLALVSVICWLRLGKQKQTQ